VILPPPPQVPQPVPPQVPQPVPPQVSSQPGTVPEVIVAPRSAGVCEYNRPVVDQHDVCVGMLS
jgi:hypothetical protein